MSTSHKDQAKCLTCDKQTDHRSELCMNCRKRKCKDCSIVFRPVNPIYSRCTPCRSKREREAR